MVRIFAPGIMLAAITIVLCAGCVSSETSHKNPSAIVAGKTSETQPARKMEKQVRKWSVREDFATAFNPNGHWSYGWVANSGAAFTLYHSQFHQDGPDGWRVDPEAPGVWVNNGDRVVCAVKPGEVAQHPGKNGEHGIVRWRAPTSCSVVVTGTFGAGDSAPVDVSVVHNTSILFESIDTRKDESFILEIDVKAGDTLDFDVGAGSQGYAYGNTPIDSSISLK